MTKVPHGLRVFIFSIFVAILALGLALQWLDAHNGVDGRVSHSPAPPVSAAPLPSPPSMYPDVAERLMRLRGVAAPAAATPLSDADKATILSKQRGDPAEPKQWQGRVDMTGVLPKVQMYDGTSWVTMATLDTLNHVWTLTGTKAPPAAGKWLTADVYLAMQAADATATARLAGQGAATAGCSISDIQVKNWKWRVEHNYSIFVGEIANRCAEQTGVQLQIVTRNAAGEVVDTDDFWPASTGNIAAGASFAFKWTAEWTPRAKTATVTPIAVRKW